MAHDHEARDSHGKSRSAPIAIILIVLVVVLPLLYILSIGPAIWLLQSGYVGDEMIGAFYLPVIALHDNVPAIGHVLEKYVEFFEPSQPVAPPMTPPAMPAPAVPAPAPSAVPAPAPAASADE